MISGLVVTSYCLRPKLSRKVVKAFFSTPLWILERKTISSAQTYLVDFEPSHVEQISHRTMFQNCEGSINKLSRFDNGESYSQLGKKLSIHIMINSTAVKSVEVCSRFEVDPYNATLYSGLDQIVRLVFESAWYENEGRNSYDEMQKIEHDCCLKRSRSEGVQTIGEQKYATTHSPPFVCIVGH